MRSQTRLTRAAQAGRRAGCTRRQRDRAMDFDDTPDQARLRTKVRRFLVDHNSELAHGDGAYLEEPGADRTDALRRTQAILADAGMIGLTWPRAYGGGGGTNAQQAVVNEELHRARVAGP